jgi:ABC-2 type transport system ATP-binding protein
MKTEIIIENLSKNFNEVRALKNVSLHIEKGMFGLIGRNGAGKTTLMRILATLLNKSGGNVSVCGVPAENPKEIRKLIGYLPQDFSVYPNMRVYEAMDYLGVLSGLSKPVRKERITELLGKVNLSSSRRLKVKALSGGMKRRLGIAQALLHDPQVLIVDEPTAGLDPEERVRFRNLLCEIAGERIVLLSTHIVEDIEKTCEKIAILNRGELIYNGTLHDFIGEEKSLEDAYMKKMKEVE